jgi:fluoride ion exporter CrcB/FEX
VRLGETNHPIAAAGYAVGSVVLGFVAAYLAMLGTRRMVGIAERGQR